MTKAFNDDSHALFCGIVMGTLIKADIHVKPLLSSNKDYTPELVATFNDTEYTITIKPK